MSYRSRTRSGIKTLPGVLPRITLMARISEVLIRVHPRYQRFIFQTILKACREL